MALCIACLVGTHHQALCARSPCLLNESTPLTSQDFPRGSFAVVTGASSGIGYELARCCAEKGFDLLIAADEPRSQSAATKLRAIGVQVQALEVDLSSTESVDRLHAATKGRPVEALLANTSRGLGHGFLDQDFADVRW